MAKNKIDIISWLPYYKGTDQLAIPTSKISDNEYIDRVLCLNLMGYGEDYVPINQVYVYDWIRWQGCPWLTESHLQKFLSEHKNYSWWFSVMSDSMGYSLDYFYPVNPHDGEVLKVYGVTDFDRIYCHKWIHGIEGLSSLLKETSIKHWAYSIII